MCVVCGAPSPARGFTRTFRAVDTIVLSRCARCGLPADKYVEWESTLVLLDLVLHRPPAFRHLLFNWRPFCALPVARLLWLAAAATAIEALVPFLFGSNAKGGDALLLWSDDAGRFARCFLGAAVGQAAFFAVAHTTLLVSLGAWKLPASRRLQATAFLLRGAFTALVLPALLPRALALVISGIWEADYPNHLLAEGGRVESGGGG